MLVLAHSRRLYVEFTVSQTMEHFLACHEQAFAAIQGVPAKLMVDNLKSAVLAAPGGLRAAVQRRAISISPGTGGSTSPPATSARGNEKDCVSYCMSSVRLASIAADHLGVALAAALDDARVGRQLVEAARAIRADPALQ